ncbi:tyrosine-protein phosphatase non-receptor type 9 isoform X2 [Drosophila ficusphila]|uniref:tyrosine-protein phosphatase non-receptor type 9 isoform X2 n=1 Tax=Drosophila ficusphila TaxID=30025 RepID=UPI0007E87626|nr:tyrosine-protein phosphatase non-receptor type 9 isoform X2 [Drosophila ficusphila]
MVHLYQRRRNREQAVKQFIDLCNNLGANCSTTTAASSSASASTASSTQNLTAIVPPQPQLQVQLPAAPHGLQFGGGGGGGAAGAGGGEGGRAAPVRRHISHTTAVKFLYARKFDIPRAVSLYEQHEQIRQKEYLYNIDPDVEPLRSELQTGKFTILPARTSSGAAIALFTANRHSPLSVSHTTTLQGIVYQLDSALQDSETQRAGLVFIYDMSGSKYSNFDYDLSQKILTLLKGGYPARLKKVLIVTAPLWFKAPFKILRLFVREKLRERVFTVSVPQLALHVPRKALPIYLGGTLEVDHATWLLSCRQSMTNREDELLANIVGGGVGGSGSGSGSPVATNGTESEAVAAAAAASSSSATGTGTAAAGAGAGAATTATTTGSTIISAVHQLGENNTTVVTVSNGVGPAGSAGESLEGPTAEVITINGLSPSHRNSSSSSSSANATLANPLKLNTSGSAENNGSSSNNTTTTNTTAAGGAGGAGAGGTTNGGGEFWSENPPSSASSGFSDDDSLAGQEGDPKPIDQIVQMVKQRGRHGLIKEYADIRNRAPEGTFLHARMRANLTKNRYTDVLCYDHSRVVLAHEDGDEPSDYINANFVDGYKQKNAYISTQGPLPKTSQDFWRMIWEQHCLVIVMTTRVMERGRVKCGQYWEPTEESSLEFGDYHVRTISVECNEDYMVASLELRNIKTDEIRNVSHWQFTSWPDYGVPSSAMAMLNFLQKVREKQAQLVAALGDTWAGHPRGPPIVVHCSAGIGRTGTFITLDICISRLEDVATADIRGTVEKIRSQRAYSIQMPDQYVFCHLALIEYAYSRGMLQTVDLAGFDEREPDSE